MENEFETKNGWIRTRFEIKHLGGSESDLSTWMMFAVPNREDLIAIPVSALKFDGFVDLSGGGFDPNLTSKIAFCSDVNEEGIRWLVISPFTTDSGESVESLKEQYIKTFQQ